VNCNHLGPNGTSLIRSLHTSKQIFAQIQALAGLLQDKMKARQSKARQDNTQQEKTRKEKCD
jgi:hypothetical protein